MKKILITGASGFISSYLIPDLVKEGNEVTGLDITPPPAALKKLEKGFLSMRVDLTSTADLYRAVYTARPTHILHLGSVLAEPCDENPVRGFAINFNSTLILLDAALTLGIKRFVMTSSIAVFGRGAAEPVRDDAHKNPSNIYGQTKLACEHLMEWYRKKHGLSSTGVRFPWVFGPGRKTGITAVYSSKLLDSIGAGEKVEIPNPGEKGDWLYVKDAVKALKLVLDAEDTPQTVYNIMGSVHSIREVVEIAKRIRPDADIRYTGDGSSSPYPASYDDSAARRDLGWKPDYMIEQAVEEHLRIAGSRIYG
ncbi:MAG: NAD(P)-dependent oxidoreductase [Spirochaetales bacterium]|nr:NAD(P)-dependent oxidoreductase [Spirochaetales bacterium]